MIIKNKNRKEYRVMDTKGKYMLLENLSWDGGYDKYLVIYNLYQNQREWQHGSYFETLEAAEDCFNKQEVY